jgi:hypothetical protein
MILRSVVRLTKREDLVQDFVDSCDIDRDDVPEGGYVEDFSTDDGEFHLRDDAHFEMITFALVINGRVYHEVVEALIYGEQAFIGQDAYMRLF